MAVRIRGKDPFEIVCAAMYDEQEGDTYIPDELHYRLSAELGLLVSEEMEKHRQDGRWYWFDEVPSGVEPDPIYESRRNELASTILAKRI